jgi:hypothetical protein
MLCHHELNIIKCSSEEFINYDSKMSISHITIIPMNALYFGFRNRSFMLTLHSLVRHFLWSRSWLSDNTVSRDYEYFYLGAKNRKFVLKGTVSRNSVSTETIDV